MKASSIEFREFIVQFSILGKGFLRDSGYEKLLEGRLVGACRAGVINLVLREVPSIKLGPLELATP